MSLQQRLVTALDTVLAVEEEPDGAVTVHHDNTIASLRVVSIGEELEMVSLTQVLAWSLPMNAGLRAKVSEYAHSTLLGTILLTVNGGAGRGDAKKTADVLLRYNFPAAGLSDGALCTLLLLVLTTGADVGRGLTA